jgi:hypothetical protein
MAIVSTQLEKLRAESTRVFIRQESYYQLFGVDNFIMLLKWKLLGDGRYNSDGRAKRDYKIREWAFTDTERVAVAHKAASFTTLTSRSPGIEGRYRSLEVSVDVPSDALRANSGIPNFYTGTSVGSTMSSMIFQLSCMSPVPFGATFRLVDASPKDASNLTTRHLVLHEWAQQWGDRHFGDKYIPQEPMHEELWGKD